MASIVATIILTVMVMIFLSLLWFRHLLKEVIECIDGAVEELNQIPEDLRYAPRLPSAIRQIEQARSLLGG